MSATESSAAESAAPPNAVAGVSMRDLLASCAAANAVSTPPRVPDPQTVERPAEHRKAA